MTLVPRKWLIEKLIQEGHLDMEDRESLGTTAIKLSEIKEIIQEGLDNGSIYPEIEVSKTGDVYGYEGYFIERISDSCYQLHSQSNNAFGVLQSHGIIGKFESFDQVVEAFVEKQYRFNIDGIEIEK